VSRGRDGTLWITDGNNQQLQKVNPVGETLHVISIIKVYAHNMAFTSSEDLLQTLILEERCC
jgi:hypothetical protein